MSTIELEGSGTIEVVGGAGGSYAGGGGGGRIWVVYESTRYWFGEFKAEGGSGYTIGGAGPVYLEVSYIWKLSQNIMSLVMRKTAFCKCKNKDADQLAVTAQLISSFVFAT